MGSDEPPLPQQELKGSMISRTIASCLGLISELPPPCDATCADIKFYFPTVRPVA